MPVCKQTHLIINQTTIQIHLNSFLIPFKLIYPNNNHCKTLSTSKRNCHHLALNKQLHLLIKLKIPAGLGMI